jgi:hypothetical protein
MIIKMLKTRTGSPDGVLVLSYSAGEKYELPEELAGVFITEGWAKPLDGRSKPNRKKDKGGAPENKSTRKINKP